ncbi:hypothetical protein GA0115261_106311, partial [Streptomyces sp. OspMP-M43]
MAGRFAPRTARDTARAALPHQAAAPARRTAPAAPEGPPLTREWTPPGPLDLRLVLGPLRRGPAGPP